MAKKPDKPATDWVDHSIEKRADHCARFLFYKFLLTEREYRAVMKRIDKWIAAMKAEEVAEDG